MRSGSATGRQRCAVYTRKSSEEGLEQNFNSLDAQREACLAYIQSQKSEGWKAVREHYDDGGYSGGNLERPALTRLLADIEAGKIDTVVVYKVDRLTRSLADFAKIVDVLDARSVSFVSVTQQFNTTTSMGRLTLNMLLSFAQFEREVTGERIRDKIAASKRKGLWMGGRVPLGYRAKGRTLEIASAEAKIVRQIFSLYERHHSVTRVTEEVGRQGLKTKVYVDKNGHRTGGRPFSRGHIHRILSNPIYAGRISHKGMTFSGQHPAIIEVEPWQRVQATLNAKAPDSRHRGSPSPLRGKLFDEHGVPFTPSHTVKSGRRYRYYVAGKAVLESSSDRRGQSWRLPAGDIEKLVARTVSDLVADRKAICDLLKDKEVSAAARAAAFDSLATWRGNRFGLVRRVDLAQEQINIELDLSEATGQALPPIRHSAPVQIRQRGGEWKLVIDAELGAGTATFDPALVKAIARARSWFEALAKGRACSFAEIAAGEGVSEQYVGKLMPLAFLSPEILEATVSGTDVLAVTTDDLTCSAKIPTSWRRQRRALTPDR